MASADLNESMNRLNLTISSDKDSNSHQHADDAPIPPSSSGGDDAINQVDQFLLDAIQNPRQRLSILRLEQDVVKFIQDPNQQQLEFQQLPTSYLRLAAHRVAQHYSLQSMVLLDYSLPDDSGSQIIVHKTSGCKPPLIRLADIPVKLPSENNTVKKIAIKQRPKKQSLGCSDTDSNSVKNQNSKSVEERTEEYSRARARIFSSSDNDGTLGGKPECESRKQDNSLVGSLDVSRVEGKSASVSDVSSSRLLVESSTNNSRARSRTETELVGGQRQSSRVAIFRDHEVDRKDPDYNRNYERFVQRFDPGFGFNGGSYTMQPMYATVSNYHTGFQQLGSTHGLQLSAEHHPQPFLQHVPGPWAPPTPAGIGYGYPETMLPFNPRQVGVCSAPTLYLHSPQYSCHCHGMPFIPHEPLHQPFAQSHQPPPDASFGMAWPW
ncbi:putative R3H domain, SUZ domain-containing protein [Medicago truncatula]|uniref:Putative R3H domain, SUZ domain-containing protein n=1 Tax=Medicago truncatula TaxID=3880 RepID=G7I368_MEDTR|nr:R3H domain-containing protein 2 isoform X1 [Medicago truncatula]XP_024640762.1 R3H domain-containing protein 2 isoform X1 [Medicago truncatula]XP_039685793.1 R3H domain-containing protein 2 isoform X1 [Medicago truncatula]XP_039685794.1 R3H domain-containing protein 2 isoform X1 [Medicago truncatula]AES62026.1 single-stranded nucleic acid-binding protein R3H [Medicago truncatula]RHN81391.1 putative R3H domain, SUZ domain-containing protein [Medicago truncatula]